MTRCEYDMGAAVQCRSETVHEFEHMTPWGKRYDIHRIRLCEFHFMQWIIEKAGMPHCQYFVGRKGQCPAESEHVLDLRIQMPTSELEKHFLYLCDTHLAQWFEDQETISSDISPA
jgi:hypothetical protein